MNVVFIFTDSHNPMFSGCYGGITRTPNIDSIAAQGVMFESAYTTCAQCVPARASLISGRYAHEIGSWDNCSPYDGIAPNWARYITNHKINFSAVGKLDYKPGIDAGFTKEMLTFNRESPDVCALFRDMPVEPRKMYHKDNYWDTYPRKDGEFIERHFTLEACKWLRNERPSDKPWVLYVGYEKPHAPWRPTEDLYNYYIKKVNTLKGKYTQTFDMLPNEVDRQYSKHSCGYTMDDEYVLKAHAGYHGAIEEVDTNVGDILNTLDELGIRDEVLIIYSCDHGELARAHGGWDKHSLYEDSIRVPLVMSGPCLPKGRVVKDPVSILDIYSTISEALGIKPAVFARGSSLINLACRGYDPYHADHIFSESHTNGMITGVYAVRKGDWKLTESLGYKPLLFNLKDDPDELENLSESGSMYPCIENVMEDLRTTLYEIGSLEGIERNARKDQRILKEELLATGRLEKELSKRGFQLDGERMRHV